MARGQAETVTTPRWLPSLRRNTAPARSTSRSLVETPKTPWRRRANQALWMSLADEAYKAVQPETERGERRVGLCIHRRSRTWGAPHSRGGDLLIAHCGYPNPLGSQGASSLINTGGLVHSTSLEAAKMQSCLRHPPAIAAIAWVRSSVEAASKQTMSPFGRVELRYYQWQLNDHDAEHHPFIRWRCAPYVHGHLDSTESRRRDPRARHLA